MKRTKRAAEREGREGNKNGVHRTTRKEKLPRTAAASRCRVHGSDAPLAAAHSQHITAHHSTAPHSTAQHSTAQHITARHGTARQARHSTAPLSTAQHAHMLGARLFWHILIQSSLPNHTAASKSARCHSPLPSTVCSAPFEQAIRTFPKHKQKHFKNTLPYTLCLFFLITGG